MASYQGWQKYSKESPAGGSTLITVAPMSRNICAARGAGRFNPVFTTVTPCSDTEIGVFVTFFA
jgi:hypothetical protein